MSLLEGAIKFILGGTLILVISSLAKDGKGSVAGILALFPVVTAISFYFMSQNLDTKAMKDAVLSSLVALPTTIIFLVVLYLCISRMDIIKALLAGVFAWLIVAVIVYNIKIRLF